MKTVLYIAVALCLAGCGGAGNLVPFSFFEGNWDGDWDGSVDSGAATLNIDATGDITGTMHADIGNEDGDVTGAIQNNGEISISVDFPSGTANGSGTLILTNAGTRLQGVVTFSGDPVTFTLDGP